MLGEVSAVINRRWDGIVPVFNLGEYETEIGNSPKEEAVLMRWGSHGLSLSMKNIETVLLPALTVKRYLDWSDQVPKCCLQYSRLETRPQHLERRMGLLLLEQLHRQAWPT